MMPFRTRATLDHTIAAIAKHSVGVSWQKDSKGFGLIVTEDGYVLTACPKIHESESFAERVLIARDDGSPMGEGHRLTRGERERAVRAILQRALERRTTAA